MKKCTKCKKEKELSEFYKNSRQFKNPKKNKDKMTTVCKKCIAKNQREYQKSHRERNNEVHRKWELKNSDKVKARHRRYWQSPKGIYRHLIKRGKDNVLISQKDFIEWYARQKQICIYCDIPQHLLCLITGNKMSKCKRLTIDRLNPKGKYEINNLGLACPVCNFLKSDIFTPTEMSEVGKIINKKWNKLYDKDC